MIDNCIEKFNSWFFDFTQNYDISNANIIRKIIHSYKVADTCFFIACKLNLTEDQRHFCYLIGLLHDAGRFEQWKLYKTYDDTKSSDHGDISAQIIDNIPKETFDITENQKELLKEAIKYHTKPYNGTDENIKFYNNIIKDADVYSNIFTIANGAMPVVCTSDGYTKEILEKFNNQEFLHGLTPKTKLDKILLNSACLYYLKQDFLRKEIVSYNMFNIILERYKKELNNSDFVVYKTVIEKLKQNY